MATPVPTVSVILPTFNRAATIRQSIQSVLQQSWQDLELIVVDDGSTDGTRSVLAAITDPRVRYVARERNGGVAAARNTGVAAARGEFLAFQDSDDEWLLEKLSSQVKALTQGAPCDLVICGLLRVGQGRVRAYPGPKPLTHASVLREPRAYTQTWLVRRQALVEAGGFDESLRVWDDWELLMRLSRQARMRVLPEPLVVSVIAEDGISRERERFVNDLERVLARHRDGLLRDAAPRAQLEYLHGRLLGDTGRCREARAAFAQALRLEPLHWRAAVLLAASLAGGARGLQQVLRLAERRST